MTMETGATAALIGLGVSSCCIIEKVMEIVEEISPKHLTVEELRTRSELVEGSVKADQVVAVQQDKKGERCARITLQVGQLCLHSLVQQPLPADARTIQHSDVVGMLVPSSTLAFLELGWSGSKRGHVTIRLAPDTPLARQFVLLCTGQQGHSFINTKLFDRRNHHPSWECVIGGDYEEKDGNGGAPLLPDLNWGYQSSGRAVGSLFPAGSSHSAQFAILTRTLHDGQLMPDVFEEVVSELNVVREAANNSNITDVTVMDCGVVLPL
nr:peptidyl-prolyl cis-trans isomerase B-like [Procambarus clarkii]